MKSTASGPEPVTPSGPRQRRRWLAVALTGLLLAGAAGVTAWRTSATRSPASTEAPALESGPELFSGLPDRLLPPPTPTALPTDRAVGRAALLYQIRDPKSFTAASSGLPQLPTYLVTATGDQFSVGPTTMGEVNQLLSPDGQWLAQRRDRQWWIRDLTGTTDLPVPPGHEVRQWSSDGQAMLLGQSTRTSETFTTFTLPTGELRPLALPAMPPRRMLAFLDGREVATTEFNLGPNHQPRSQLTIAIQDIDGHTRSVSIPTTQQVGPGDIRDALVPLVRGGGDPPTVWALVASQEDVPTSQPQKASAALPMTLVGVDLRSGKPAGRIDLVTPQGDEGEEFIGLAGTAILLQRWTTDAVELVAANPTTGQRRVLTSLPDHARVILPGD
ncbi:hypothetical protein [Micromonospora sp. WMMD964]|uniref:hypothetical protein n=1 Tax=Micromonospora sp. WMMD964 TaxID=3016091 RepID=UPI00249C7C23|nr:hypothetical protein [Micromonospora sp. WMMD964]WFE98577.1 hypothetical protein O7616_16835 [Micromonospora sp. WMMD964]